MPELQFHFSEMLRVRNGGAVAPLLGLFAFESIVIVGVEMLTQLGERRSKVVFELFEAVEDPLVSQLKCDKRVSSRLRLEF